MVLEKLHTLFQLRYNQWKRFSIVGVFTLLNNIVKLFVISILLLLTACANKEQVQIIVYDHVLDNASAYGEYELRLSSDKEVYSQGDLLQIKGELVYSGDRESVTITSADPLIVMETINLTDDYYFGSISQTISKETTLYKNKPYVQTYHFSGGSYTNGKGEPYSEELLFKMIDGNYPAGQYRIVASSSFSTHTGEMIRMETFIIVTVLE